MATTLLLNKFQQLINKKIVQSNQIDQTVFGQKENLINKLFGCHHENISRPFTQGKTAYRVCLNCGARKQFDTNTLKTYGSFYSTPVIK
jgi:transcription elongation factor Elf1